MCGIVFIKNPSAYQSQLNFCERYVERAWSTNVLLLYLEHFAFSALILLLLCVSGIHIAALAFPSVFVLFRGYTLGGSLAIFFSVYRFSGALIVFALYLPVHLLSDAVYFLAIGISFFRAPHFCFSRGEFFELLSDLLVLLGVMAVVLISETVLLLCFFRAAGI